MRRWLSRISPAEPIHLVLRDVVMAQLTALTPSEPQGITRVTRGVQIHLAQPEVVTVPRIARIPLVQPETIRAIAGAPTLSELLVVVMEQLAVLIHSALCVATST